jgi:hypothetical protein
MKLGRTSVGLSRRDKTKAPRFPGRSQNSTDQCLRQRPWSALPPGACWNLRSGSTEASSPPESRARGRRVGARCVDVSGSTDRAIVRGRRALVMEVVDARTHRPSGVALRMQASHQKHSNEYQCCSHQRKICGFYYDIRKSIIIYHALLLKKFYRILASDISARGLRDEAWRVTR